MNEPEEKGIEVIKKALSDLVDRVRKREGYPDHYVLNLTDKIAENVDVALTSGNPPVIHFNLGFVLWCFSEKKLNRLRDRVDRALSKVDRMSLSLSNLEPPNALILHSTFKAWMRSNRAAFMPPKPKYDPQILYKVVAYDASSECEIVLSSESITELSKLKDKALNRLNALVNEEAALEHVYTSDEISYREIKISGDDEEVRVDYE